MVWLLTSVGKYSYGYQVNHSSSMEALKPGLFSRGSLFKDPFNFGHSFGKWPNKIKIEDVRPHLPEFSSRLRDLLEELFGAAPFRQTTYVKTCLYCPYKSMCRR